MTQTEKEKPLLFTQIAVLPDDRIGGWRLFALGNNGVIYAEAHVYKNGVEEVFWDPIHWPVRQLLEKEPSTNATT